MSNTRDETTAKWMVNILNEPAHRTRYIQMLEKITPSPYVTFMRMIISLGLIVVIIIAATFLLLTRSSSFIYTGPWVILGAASAVALVGLYALPHRSKSLISTAAQMLASNAASKAAGANSSLGTIGVEAVTVDVVGSGSALIEFDDGCVGYMYKVDGNVSRSTLPAVAASVCRARRNRLVGRQSTTQEILITRIITSKMTSQLQSLKRSIDDATGDTNHANDMWRKYMAATLYDYVYDNMRDGDSVIEQYLILREDDITRLAAAHQLLVNDAANGAYARITRLSKATCENVLQSLTQSVSPALKEGDGVKQLDM